MMARARQLPGATPCSTPCCRCAASSEDPISGGRHKVWGSAPLWVPPQTSTIASHLPKAVGLGVRIARAATGSTADLPRRDRRCAVVRRRVREPCDGAGRLQCRALSRKRGVPVPVLFLCEDNGIGISVATPRNWIQETFSRSPARLLPRRGELDAVFEAARQAIDIAATRAPTFLHLRDGAPVGPRGQRRRDHVPHVRGDRGESKPAIPLLAQRPPAGWSAARPPTDDPARPLSDTREGTRVNAAADEASRRPKLTTRERVVAPLAPVRRRGDPRSPPRPSRAEARSACSTASCPNRTAAPSARSRLPRQRRAARTCSPRPETLLFGEDVAKKGGVYHVTMGLADTFGVGRVFDTLLDETTILGLAQGAAHIGCLPFPEIQYLAYIHNALDQIRGEACSLQFFSRTTATCRCTVPEPDGRARRRPRLPEGLRRPLPQRQLDRRAARHPGPDPRRAGARRRRRADAAHDDRAANQFGKRVSSSSSRSRSTLVQEADIVAAALEVLGR
jgi:2-oxoisovalerate dehydrogenase E1 component